LLPSDVQFLENDPVSQRQYEALQSDSQGVLTRFLKDNGIHINDMCPASSVFSPPARGDAFTPPDAVRSGTVSDTSYDKILTGAGEGEEQRKNQKDDRYDFVLLSQVGHRALTDVGRDLFHAVRSLAAAHHRAKEIPCESESHEGGQRNDPEDKRGVVHRTVVLGCLEFGFDRSRPVRRMASSLSDRLSLLAKKRKHPKLINYFI